MINRIIEYSLKNKILIILVALILTILGVKYLFELPVDVYPDLNAPVVTVITESPGMAPEDVETLITFPMETAFNSLPHVSRVRSNSALGYSKINIDFEYGTNIYFARQLVTEKLQMITPSLPEQIDPPFIGPISSMFADAIEFTIKGDDLFEVRDFAEWDLKPRLQTVGGVSNVINMGGFLKQYHVLIDPNKLLNFNIQLSEVLSALKANNVNSSGGFLIAGPEEKIIRGIGRIKSIADIESIVLKQWNGIPITIGDIAKVEVGAYIRRGSAGESGAEVVIVTVQNQYNANVMKTISGVEEVLDKIKSEQADKFTIETFYTQLDMIIKSIKNVSWSIIIGGLLVVLVLLIFLNNIKSTVVVALAIPLSAIFAFIFFKIFGLTINIMTLGGLAIGLGMIVDSSIIMVENIFRHIQQGKVSFSEAVRKGAKEVGAPIFYAILILLAVFAPIFTLQGIEGKMFIPLTFAVSAAVLGSLLISLTLTPTLTSLLFKTGNLGQQDGILMRAIKKIYHPLFNHTMKHPTRVGATCLVILALGIGLSFYVGTEFMPEMDESSLLVDVLLPPEASLDESSRIASLVAAKIASIPEVERVIRATGKARGAEHTAPVNLTHANCVLVPKEKRSKSIDQIKAEIRNATHAIPGVLIQINAPLQHRINHVVTGIRSAIAVKIFGENLNTINEISNQIHNAMVSVPGVTDLQIEQISGVPQIEIRLKRDQLARYGINISDISLLIETALNGKVATELIETQKRYEIFVRYEKVFRDDIEKISNLMIQTQSGYRIPLSQVADFIENKNPSIIRKENALRRGVVQCNVSGRDMGSVANEIKEKISQIALPEGYFVSFGGTYENQLHAIRQLTVVIVLTLIIVFLLLTLSFRSFKNALLIIINIPLALAGGIIILFISGNTISVPSIVGFIALIGISVQDGIVLVNHINHNRQSGMNVAEAVAQAGSNKIRPVLMTTFTTMLGLIPLAVRNVTGSEMQKPLALVIMFGLLFSTVITLGVLPALYAMINREK
ncbi:MAG TPA: efflux RND transporter permease subunit [bacterium]|nr:efflux RND transporter permease subunit [bacterium]